MVHQTQQLLPEPPPLPPTDTSMPILVISVAIPTTAILLLAYYVFVIKCSLSWQSSSMLNHLSRSQSRWRTTNSQTLPSLYSSSAVADRGLEESAIQAIPTLKFRRAERQNGFHECAVCLNEFQEEEKIRVLPTCLHVFHIDCIDTWLQTHANCPICRAAVMSTGLVTQPSHDQGDRVVINVGDESGDQNPETNGSNDSTNCTNSSVGKGRKLPKVSSLGEECIGVREEDQQFAVQPIRRSFSMDLSSDLQIYMAVQEVLRQNPHFREIGNGEGTSTSSGRSRRLFFSFGGHGRISKGTVLPTQNEQ